MECWQPVAVKQVRGTRVLCTLVAGVAPTPPDFLTRLLKDVFVSCVFPQHKVFDDSEKALSLIFLCLLSLEDLWVSRGVVHHLCENNGPGCGERPPCPPLMKIARMSAKKWISLFKRRCFIDCDQWQCDFD